MCLSFLITKRLGKYCYCCRYIPVGKRQFETFSFSAIEIKQLENLQHKELFYFRSSSIIILTNSIIWFLKEKMSNLLLYFFVICCMLSSIVECFPEIQAMIKAVLGILFLTKYYPFFIFLLLGKSNLRKLGIKNPTAAPIPVPSQNPSIKPTRAPVTKSPSLSPSFKPTPGPPTKRPSRFPSFRPSQTKKPSPAPTSYSPTAQPTLRPTKAPTTRAPSTTRPTKGPTTSRPTYSLAPTYPPGTLVASWTYYNSYPRCCASQPNYDPSYPTTECTDYSGCAHPGLFAGIGQRSLDYVQS